MSRIWTSFLLCVWIWLVQNSYPPVLGQSPSSKESRDFVQQIEVLKSLQRILRAIEQGELKAQFDENASENPQQLELSSARIRQLLEIARTLDGAESIADSSQVLGDLSPELLRKLTSDPQSREFLRSILESMQSDQQQVELSGNTIPQSRASDDEQPPSVLPKSGLLSNVGDALRNWRLPVPESNNQQSSANRSTQKQSTELGLDSQFARRLRGSNFWDTVQKAVENQRLQLRPASQSDDTRSKSQADPFNSSEKTSGSVNSSNLKSISDSLGKSLQDLSKGIGKKIKQVASDPRFRPPERPKKSDRLFTSEPSRSSPEIKKPPAGGAAATEPTSESVAAREELADIDSATITTPQSNVEQSNANAIGNGGLLALLSLVLSIVVLVIVGYIQKKWFVSLWHESITERRQSIKPWEVSNRNDIVRAYHQLAGTGHNPASDWWTPRRAAQHLATKNPTAGQPLQLLLELYEKARYCPEQFELTDAEIESARRALERCEKCSSP